MLHAPLWYRPEETVLTFAVFHLKVSLRTDAGHFISMRKKLMCFSGLAENQILKPLKIHVSVMSLFYLLYDTLLLNRLHKVV